MIRATVSSRFFCLFVFCWLYRASPSLAAKNIINLISILTIWWCPYVKLSLRLLEKGVCYDQCVLLAKLCYPLPSFILDSKAKCTYYFRYLLISHFTFQSPMMKRTFFFGIISRKCCRSSQKWSISASLALVVGGIDLDYRNVECFAKERNWDQ